MLDKQIEVVFTDCITGVIQAVHRLPYYETPPTPSSVIYIMDQSHLIRKATNLLPTVFSGQLPARCITRTSTTM